FGMFAFDLAQHIEAGTVRKIDIEQDCRWQLRLKLLYRFCREASFHRGEAPTLQGFAERPANHLVVVNYKDLFVCIFGGHQCPRIICLLDRMTRFYLIYTVNFSSATA